MGRLSDGRERLGGMAVAIGGTLGPDWVEKVTVVFCCVPETRDIPSGFLHSGDWRERSQVYTVNEQIYTEAHKTPI